jgi:hypothetical protein
MSEVLANPEVDPSLKTFSYLDGIVYPNKPDLEEFLKNHQENVPLIQYTCNVARSVFEESTQLSLEVDYDPETPDITLLLMVRQKQYNDDPDIDDKIKSIRKMYRSSGLVDTDDFHVMTDYQPPLDL